MSRRKWIDDLGKPNGFRKQSCSYIWIATWKILSLYRTDACQNLTEMLEKYKVSIPVLQKIRWTGAGQISIGEYIIYFKGMESRHHFCKGFAIHKYYDSRVTEFYSISERVNAVRIKTKPLDIFTINIHSHTENNEDNVKEFFYDDLTRICDNALGNTIKIIIRGANDKIRNESYYVPTIGLECAHDLSNDNGAKLISFAASRNMVISSTTFPHKKNI